MTRFLDVRRRVRAETAKQDKIRLNLGSWIVWGDGAVTCIGDLVVNNTPRDWPAPNNQQIFGHIRVPHRFLRIAIIIGNHGQRSGNRIAPLFAGRANVRPIPMHQGRWPASRIEMELTLNPTRYVNYQTTPRRLDGPVESWLWEDQPRMFSPRRRFGNEYEEPLDGSDNVLIGRHKRRFAQGPEAWARHFETYWRSVIETLNREIENVASRGFANVEPPSDLNLRQVETYWEFEDDDPVDTVRRLEPYLWAWAQETAETAIFRGRQLFVTGTQNSRSVTVTRRNGCSIRFYAKTTRRVRVEVIHDLMQDADPIGGRHTTDDLEQLFPWCQMLAREAASEANRILGFLFRRLATEPDPAQPYELPLAIARVVSAPDQAAHITSALVNNGYISAPRNSRYASTVALLVNEHILVQSRRWSRRFCVTNKYVSALDWLRQYGERPPGED